MKHTTISVNGTVYDSQTGKPLRRERGQGKPIDHDATTVHASLQRSQTLDRRYIHREHPAVPSSKTTPQIIKHRAPIPKKAQRRIDGITRFPKQPVTSVHSTITKPDVAPTPNQLVTKAQHHIAARQHVAPARIPKPAHLIKQESIEHALAQAPSHTAEARTQRVPRRQSSNITRRFRLAAASLAVLLLGAYLTYLNMPAISTRVAAAQAGINASYPGYSPTGYSLNGPVAYQQGGVTMKFVANASPQSYTLSQTSSDWDSSAVLDDYITPQAGDHYSTTTASGLTIYTYNNNAAWVNNGILYTINGDANLSDTQIQHIATSL